MNELVQGIAFTLAVFGYFLNGTRKYRNISYIIWVLSNGMWVYIANINNNNWLEAMFIVYIVFCIYNLIKK